MHYGIKTLRITLTGTLVALAAAVPVAQAQPVGTTAVSVCNQATHTSLGGDLVATDGDTGAAARHQSDLKAKPGNGAGLLVAATRSRALTLCSKPAAPAPITVGWGDN